MTPIHSAPILLTAVPATHTGTGDMLPPGIPLFLSIVLLVTTGILYYFVKKSFRYIRKASRGISLEGFLDVLTADDIRYLQEERNKKRQIRRVATTSAAMLLPILASAKPASQNLWLEPGILITLTLILIPIILGVCLLIIKMKGIANRSIRKNITADGEHICTRLGNIADEELDHYLAQRLQEHEYRPSSLLRTTNSADPERIIDNSKTVTQSAWVAKKKPAAPRPAIAPDLSRLILWYIGCATFWLLFGTTVGEYLGIKFVAPDADQLSWLSFGRLRPVHTNAVFWGWASLAMLGLGYYVVPTVGNTRIHQIKLGYYSLILINAALLCGSLCLMAGINNGGGEYREYTWPVMSLFAAGLVITLYNYIQTITTRKVKEIYISNWYIVAAIIFTTIIATIAYWPSLQLGLGETIVQGYYMHQGVGMWFMLFNLGLVYYFLPQQLNKPIYSYNLGILAFWSQIFFYTVIGTHHFVFSSIPWWLQTVAIVGSVGMLIPVTAGSINFYMTFKGNWSKVASSYTLPFYLTGIVFYFTGSYQGTAEAFRFTNQIWHFTDFTVAHSHLTMYGIITFLLWGSIYAIVPRITGSEAPQWTIGAHFWLALIGLLFYTVPLMIGGTLKGLMWMDGKPFIDSVTMMAPYWVWRAVGGTMMWFSHIVFAYNVYKMFHTSEGKLLKEQTISILKSEHLLHEKAALSI